MKKSKTIKSLVAAIVGGVFGFFLSGCAGLSPAWNVAMGAGAGAAAGNASSIISVAQAADDKISSKIHSSNELAVIRADLAAAEAQKANLTLLPAGTIAFPTEWRDASGTLLTNGVIQRQVYEVHTVLVPTPIYTPQPIPPAGGQWFVTALTNVTSAQTPKPVKGSR